MKFKLPEDLTSLSLEELSQLREDALIESLEISGLADDEITDEQLGDLESLTEAIGSLDAQAEGLKAAATARADKLSALRGKTDAAKAAQNEPEVEEEPAEEPDEDTEPVEVPDDISSLEEEKEPVAASAVRKVAGKAPAVIIKNEEEPVVANRVSMVAAANVPEMTAGQDLVDLDGVARAFAARAKGFAKGKGGQAARKDVPNGFALSNGASRFGVARIQKPENEFSTGMDKPVSEQMETIFAAAKESRLPGSSLVAAGGWCAPSETLYDFCSLETVSGILSLPEVTASRGGINFTKGPDYSSIAAAWGFIQTEAQAEAGTEKTCYEVECPDFDEVRLDAIGFCISAGVLTNAAYPELIRRVLEIGTVAHAHKVNATVISRISTAIGAAVDHAEIGATTSDVLDALSIQVTRLRYQYSLDPKATIEAVFPVWAKEIFRSDLSRRTGVDLLAVTDAMIQSYLGVRGVAAQWVYDYQNFVTGNTGAWTSFPDTLEVMLYPAGSFVKLTTDVLDLDTIYDSVGLGTNTYTAAFFEEGLAIANTCASGVKVAIDIAGLYGNTGAANVAAAAA